CRAPRRSACAPPGRRAACSPASAARCAARPRRPPRRLELSDHTGPPTAPRAGRPEMPSGYGINRATDEGLLPWSFVQERLTTARNYWIATARPDGRPHVAPVWGLWLDEAFYFSTDPASRKARNLQASPALVVHLESGDDVVILEGTAERVADPYLRDRFAEAYDAKY